MKSAHYLYALFAAFFVLHYAVGAALHVEWKTLSTPALGAITFAILATRKD
jgi:hypothetical protein